MEREQEREEANEQQKKMEALLNEKEKECERTKTAATQLSLEVQQLQDALKMKDKTIQVKLVSKISYENLIIHFETVGTCLIPTSSGGPK